MRNGMGIGLAKWAMGTAATYGAVRWMIDQSRAYDFRGKVVVLTGGSRGLGLVLARRLAEEGARLAICARDMEELALAEAELSQVTEVYSFPCDLLDSTEIDAFVQSAREVLGPVDVLIHNAGIIQVGPLESLTMRDFEEAMAVHFWAALRLTRNVLPDMIQRQQGRIVNISSIGGKVSVPHLLPYCASKFALVGLSQGLRSMLMKEGIYVTTVCPGLMRTGSHRQAIVKGNHEAEYAWFSIGDSLPFLSMNANLAARRILKAARYGRAEAVLSLPARVAALGNQCLPELSADLLALTEKMLPDAPSGSTLGVKGSQATSEWSPSFLTTLSERAAAQNNQLVAEERNVVNG